MDLMSIHSLMREKGFHYISGNTNDSSSLLSLEFTTGYNGRGNAIEINIEDANNAEINLWLGDEKVQITCEPQLIHQSITNYLNKINYAK